MARVEEPRQSVLTEIRRTLTHMEFDLMEPEPCGDRLEVNAQRIAGLLFDHFAQETQERPIMLCYHCGRDEFSVKQSGHNYCLTPFDQREHEMTKPHPYLTTKESRS